MRYFVGLFLGLVLFGVGLATGLGALDGLWGVGGPGRPWIELDPGPVIVWPGFSSRTMIVHAIGYAVAAASGTTLLLGSLLWGIRLPESVPALAREEGAGVLKDKEDLAGMRWVKEVGMKSRWGLWSIGMNCARWVGVGVEVAIIVVVGAVVGVVQKGNPYAVGIAVVVTMAVEGVIDGIYLLVHSSRCLEASWRLEERAREESLPEIRKEIELGAAILRDYQRIDLVYAVALLAIPAGLLAVSSLLIR